MYKYLLGLLLLCSCQEDLKPISTQRVTIVRVWGGKVMPDFIDVVYGDKVYRLESPPPSKSYYGIGDDLIIVNGKLSK